MSRFNGVCVVCDEPYASGDSLRWFGWKAQTKDERKFGIKKHTAAHASCAEARINAMAGV